MPTKNATINAFPEIAVPTTRARSDRAVGLFVMAVLPALFWTVMLAVFGPLLGFAPSAATLAVTTIGIGSFLALVCCAATRRA